MANRKRPLVELALDRSNKAIAASSRVSTKRGVSAESPSFSQPLDGVVKTVIEIDKGIGGQILLHQVINSSGAAKQLQPGVLFLSLIFVLLAQFSAQVNSNVPKRMVRLYHRASGTVASQYGEVSQTQTTTITFFRPAADLLRRRERKCAVLRLPCSAQCQRFCLLSWSNRREQPV
jgi:hypothetical protein